jgi:hypothetical protein
LQNRDKTFPITFEVIGLDLLHPYRQLRAETFELCVDGCRIKRRFDRNDASAVFAGIPPLFLDPRGTERGWSHYQNQVICFIDSGFDLVLEIPGRHADPILPGRNVGLLFQPGHQVGRVVFVLTRV